MEEPNQYQIKTVQDMLECTNSDNIDNFLKDLKGVLLSAHLLVELSNEIEVLSEGYVWIDDNKHNISIELTPTE
jgi:hypothetical protein